MDTGGLKVVWLDHTGRGWNLTSGEQGVILAEDQPNFGQAEIEQVFSDMGTQHLSTVMKNIELDLAIIVGEGLTGGQYFSLADKWWAKANSPLKTGTLVVYRPDGELRTLVCRLRQTPGTTHRYDPGIGAEDKPVEAWQLVADSPFYYGDRKELDFGIADRAGTPFYGPNGRGWPLYIGGNTSSSNWRISNDGDIDMWPLWTFHGPATNIRFGVSGKQMRFNGTLAAGEMLSVDTDPRSRQVLLHRSDSSVVNALGDVTGQPHPIPVGESRMEWSAEGIAATSRAQVSGIERFFRAF